METLQGSKDRRAELDDRMDRRRKHLRLTWAQVAERAGMVTPNLLRIRKNKIGISWEAADGINDALRWTRGSVEAFVTDGIEPTPIEDGDLESPPRPVMWTPQKEADFRRIQALLAVYDLEMNEDDFERMTKRKEKGQRVAAPQDHSG